MNYYLSPEAIEAGCVFEQPRDGDAGYDIYAVDAPIFLGKVTDMPFIPGKQWVINTGLHVAIPQGYVGIIKDRSSMASRGIHVLGGVIDSSYRGEIKVVMIKLVDSEYLKLNEVFTALMTDVHINKAEAKLRWFVNDTRNRLTQQVKAGDKIAQLLIVPVHTPRLSSVSSIDALGITERGNKGFGSTDN